jgi:dTMP kinase
MAWIVVDGIDGSGKSTCARWISDYYEGKGKRVLLRMHPSSRWTGRMTRSALEGRGKLMHLLATLFFILDVLNSLRTLKRDSRRYDTVIYVRYIMGAAYLPDRMAKFGYEAISKVLPMPERLLLVDIDPQVALRRISERRERTEMFEDADHLSETRARMRRLARGWAILDNSPEAQVSRAALISILEKWDGACSS